MTMRHKRKITKQRGTRTCGGGNKKNRRGSGSHMGNPHIKSKGGGQRNFMHLMKYMPEKLKQKGFLSLRKKVKAINLDDLQKLTDEIEIDVTDFGFNKVLGGGELDKRIKKVSSVSFSAKAIEKIKKAGAKAVKIGETNEPENIPTVN